MTNKMKIGIITILKVNNYGAELQAFALQKKLANLGFNAEIIDYLYYKHKDFRHTRQARPFVKLGFKRRLKEFLNPLLEQIKSLPYRKEKRIRETKFESFHLEHTKVSSQTYRTINVLYQASLDYDVFMVGSDQVWNPFSNVSLKPYFLTFAPDSKRKISYASSFGVSSIPPDAHATYRECLNNLDHISVREEQGVRLVKELSGRDASHVVDPTLLMDEQDWREVATFPVCKKPYILLYVLTDSSYSTQLAKQMAAGLGWNVVRICKNAAKDDRNGSIQNIIDAGPAEFIGLFLNASFVLTNSFHGTAFSLNFGKPFYTILPRHKPNNSRQQSLLSTLQLEERLIKDGDPFPEKERYLPDFTEAARLLKAKREESVNFLITAIKGSRNV